jgi:hypothetical protein
MANAPLFYQTFVSQINQFIQILDDLNTMQDRLAQDPTLAAAAAAAAQPQRPDLTAQSFTNAADAINQVLFAYNSGAPPQKSLLYKML